MADNTKPWMKSKGKNDENDAVSNIYIYTLGADGKRIIIHEYHEIETKSIRMDNSGLWVRFVQEGVRYQIQKAANEGIQIETIGLDGEVD